MTSFARFFCDFRARRIGALFATVAARAQIPDPNSTLPTHSPPQAHGEVSTADQDALARQAASAAVELAATGKPEVLWPLLRQSADNGRRSHLIHALGAIDARVLLQRLEIEPDVSVRRALILALGDFSGDRISAPQREHVVSVLLRWYRDDPDPGIHGAVDWLLRFGVDGSHPRNLDWHQAAALDAIDHELAGRASGSRDWGVTKEGFTMVFLRNPPEFVMGSPPDETGRVPASDSPNEDQHRAHIPRSYAVANRAVTRQQFQRFLTSSPNLNTRFRVGGNSAREPQTPQVGLNWYEAAAYCNWLSEQEGLPPSEWVYPANLDEIKDGMALPPNYLHRTGYRLLTEAEWEYAARCGATTARFFGQGTALLHEYAWYAKSPQKKKSDPMDPGDPHEISPVGRLKPNDFGLFDVYGNIWTWCQDRLQEDLGKPGVREDVEDEILVISDRVSRTRRGGAFVYGAEFMRSANRDSRNDFPHVRRTNVGFRVARTLAP